MRVWVFPYEPMLVIRAQSQLLKDADKLAFSKPYRFDIVDVQRQMMTNLGQLVHKRRQKHLLPRIRRPLPCTQDVFLNY